MPWQNNIVTAGTQSLADYWLYLIGTPSTGNVLTGVHLQEIITALRNGFLNPRTGETHTTFTGLAITQYTLRCNVAAFRLFINELLSMPQITMIDFCGLMNWEGPWTDACCGSVVLDNEQTSIFTEALASNSTITHLVFNVVDSREAANAIAQMISANTTLRKYRCNLTDDFFDFPVLKAALMAGRSSLRLLHMPSTCIGYGGECRLFSDGTLTPGDVTNRGLKVIGEGGLEINVP